MRKLMRIGAAATCAAMLTAVLGHGSAWAAPDVSGQTYAKAKDALSKAGLTPTVVTRVGDRISDDDCIVIAFRTRTSSMQPASPPPTLYTFYLNCYGNVASNKTPGYSAQNPMGKTVQANQSQS